VASSQHERSATPRGRSLAGAAGATNCVTARPACACGVVLA
jgi:hypothetical protein